MNSKELITKLYNPIKITKKGKSTIITTKEGLYNIKEKNKDLSKLYKYLDNRGFTNYPKLIDDTRSEYNILEYIPDSNYPKEQKYMDMIDLVSDLHNKTMHYKSMNEDKYKEIYDNISNNLIYYKNNYTKLVDMIENEKFMSPSHYLFIRSSSKLFSQIKFCEDKLNEWFNSIKNTHEEEVCINHNNLELDHFRKDKDAYLISFDNYKIDTPIFDIYKLYRKEALNVNFKPLLDRYFNNVNINDADKKLFLIMICIPEDIKFENHEYTSCKHIQKILDYTYKTEALIGSYYVMEDKKESDEFDN